MQGLKHKANANAAMRMGIAAIPSQSIQGFKQGCPMSPVLFALAMDPFIRKLHEIIPPTACMRAYADDLAVVLPHFVCMPALRNLFALQGKAANLKVNVSKTVIVPRHKFDPTELKEQFGALGWEGVQIQKDSAKYICFYVGPAATSEVNCQEPLNKFHTRASCWLNKPELGPTLLALAFNVFILPTLSFVAQLHRLPSDS